jgi:DNA primase
MKLLLDILEKYVDLEQTGEDEYICTCPFHDDQKPSCSVNTKKRIYFCHSCSAKGSILKFLSKVTGYTEAIIKSELNQIQQLKNGFPDFNTLSHCNNLVKNKDMLTYLIKERGWTKQIIQQNNIGWDVRKGRVTIPIYNIFGDLLNVRCYKTKAGKGDYKVLNLRGFGSARLYGVDSFKSRDTIYLCEGEPDRLAALSIGLSSCSSTSGAGHFSSTWSCYFKDRSVVILYDSDEAGRTGAEKVVRILAPVASDCRVIKFKADQDLTDYLNAGGTAESLRLLVEQTKPADKSMVVSEESSERDDTIYEVTLSESSEEAYYHKRVKMNVMVSGKTLSPYLVPKKVDISCDTPGLNMCKGCNLGFDGGSKTLHFGSLTEETLQLVETSVDNHSRIYKERCGISPRCRLFTAKIVEAQNVEEAKVIPNLDFSTDESEYVMRQIFYIGHGLRPNSSYKIEGLTLPHPKTQQVTYLVEKAEPLEDSVNSFAFTEELIEAMKVFCVEDTKET